MDTKTPAHLPIGVMPLNEFLSDTNQVTWQWNPIEVSDQEVAVWTKETSCLCGGLRSIEPMPALTRRHYVKCTAGQAGIFSMTNTVLGVNPLSGVKLLSLRKQRLGQ